LLGAFSLVVTQFQSISAFSAVISRLSGLSEAVHGLEAQAAPPIAIDHRDGPLVCDGLTLRSGTDGTVLLAGLKLTVMPGRRWLVTVAENAAKQAFFRALAGLWEHGEGRIERPGLEGTFFLPERPYLPPGPLREVLVRTVNEGKTPDEEITAVLARLGLEEIVARVGGLQVDHEWDGYLSISEQHLFAVARILLTHPAFAVLDRPGSSLSSSQISTVLDLLAEQGIGTIVLAKDSESHLPYDAKLEIFGDGTWKIS
jgi:putative ATP-binding cassette transporter